MDHQPDLFGVCSKCHTEARGEGLLQVDQHAAQRSLKQHREFDARLEEGSISPAKVLAQSPPVARWEVRCANCADADAPEYTVALASADTYRGLLDLTAHLMSKPWFRATNWESVLHGLRSGNGPLRPVQQGR